MSAGSILKGSGRIDFNQAERFVQQLNGKDKQLEKEFGVLMRHKDRLVEILTCNGDVNFYFKVVDVFLKWVLQGCLSAGTVRLDRDDLLYALLFHPGMFRLAGQACTRGYLQVELNLLTALWAILCMEPEPPSPPKLDPLLKDFVLKLKDNHYKVSKNQPLFDQIFDDKLFVDGVRHEASGIGRP